MQEKTRHYNLFTNNSRYLFSIIISGYMDSRSIILPTSYSNRLLPRVDRQVLDQDRKSNHTNDFKKLHIPHYISCLKLIVNINVIIIIIIVHDNNLHILSCSTTSVLYKICKRINNYCYNFYVCGKKSKKRFKREEHALQGEYSIYIVFVPHVNVQKRKKSYFVQICLM